MLHLGFINRETHMKRRVLSTVIVLAVCAGAALFAVLANSGSAQEAKKSGVAEFMRGKLASSQSVLEGLVTDDFKMMEDGSKKLVAMSNAAEWQVIQGPVYGQYSAEFRRSAEQLGKMAKEENTDGASLAYVQVTLNCINCHKFVKTAKIAANEEIPKGLAQALAHDKTLFAVRHN